MFFAPILLSAAFVSANIGASGSELIQPTKQQVAIASDGSGRAPSQHPMSSLLQVQLASRLAARLGVKNEAQACVEITFAVIAGLCVIGGGIYGAYEKWGIWAVVGGAIGTIVLVLLIIGAIVYCCRNRQS